LYLSLLPHHTSYGLGRRRHFSEYDRWTYHEGQNQSAGRAVIELRHAILIARRYSLIELKLKKKGFSDHGIADPSW
jgi:hypothetical protein